MAVTHNYITHRVDIPEEWAHRITELCKAGKEWVLDTPIPKQTVLLIVGYVLAEYPSKLSICCAHFIPWTDISMYTHVRDHAQEKFFAVPVSVAAMISPDVRWP